MKTSLCEIERGKESREECASRELAQRIRKLRWIGMAEEAKRLQAALSRMPRIESVLLLPMDTDERYDE
jgi:hypothetical protein